MKIGVIGVGMVGGTISFGFRKLGHEVIEHDPKLNTKLDDVLPADLIFVCVPTPQAEDGSCDTSVVEEVVRALAQKRYSGVVVIKSTVTPGTTDVLLIDTNLRLAFCPEFLRERCAVSDFIEHHDVCIVGTYSVPDYELIKEAHGDLPKQSVRVTPIEAEMSKYFSNTFNALRIIFANQFYEVCESIGASYSVIKDAITKRTSIGDHYLDCNSQFRSYGGNCLPKDNSAFARFVDGLGLSHLKLFRHVVDDNERIKAREREKWVWERNSYVAEYNELNARKRKQ